MKTLFNNFSKKIDKLEKEIHSLNNAINEMKKIDGIIIFWDIENMPIPKHKDAFEFVSIIKEYTNMIYPDYKITIKCYFEEKNLSDKNKMLLNDAGCHLHLVPNPYKKKERSDMLIIRDMFDIDEKNIVGLISSDGDFKPYLTKLKEKNIELFIVTNNKKYDIFLPNVINWNDLCLE